MKPAVRIGSRIRIEFEGFSVEVNLEEAISLAEQLGTAIKAHEEALVAEMKRQRRHGVGT